MKKTLLTSSIIAAFTLNTHTTFANESFEIDEHIVVTANRSQQEQFLSLSATQVIGEKEIEILQPQSVTDLLDKVAGISVVNNGGAGQNSTVFMRGTNSGHTLVLVDGIRVGSATLGSTNFGAMSIAQIDRIEVVKGPRAALWGSDAIGGVIQIFTKKLSSGEGVVSVGVGSNNLRKADASFGLGSNDHNLTFTVAAEDSDGFSATKSDEYAYEQDDDGYDRLSFGAVGKSEISDEFTIHLASRWDQAGSEYDPKYGGANESDSDNYYVRLAGQYKKNALFTEVSAAKSRDQATTFGNGIKESDGNAIKTQREQFSILSQYSFDNNTAITAGFDWYTEKVAANYDLDGWSEGYQKWQDDDRDVSAVFTQLRHQANKFLFEGAIRHDDIEGLDAETTYNLSVGYQLSDDLLMSVSHATAFKAPSFNDLYWPGSGNPELKPEDVTSSELLVRKQYKNGVVEVSFFDSEIENLIAWAPNDLGAWQPSNINQAEISGVELSLAMQSGEFSHQLALSFIEAEDAEKNIQLARRPEFTGNYTVSYQWNDYAFNGVFSYRDESPDTTNESAVILDDYWLVDLSVNYQATEQVVITGKVNNIFDEEYETAQNYIADGINYTLTASYSF
jgi:vitamin B12 transporter